MARALGPSLRRTLGTTLLLLCLAGVGCFSYVSSGRRRSATPVFSPYFSLVYRRHSLGSSGATASRSQYDFSCPSLLADALDLYALRQAKPTTFAERYLHNKQLAARAKQTETLLPRYMEQASSDLDAMSDYEAVRLVWGLGTLGIGLHHSVGAPHSVWERLQYRVSRIDLSSLHDSSQVLPHDAHSEFSPSAYSAYLIEGASLARLVWRKLDPALRQALDAGLGLVLSDIVAGRFEQCVVFLQLSRMDARISDLSSPVAALFREAIYRLVSAHFPVANTDFADFLHAVGSIDSKLLKTNSKLRARIQMLVQTQGRLTPLRNVWRLVEGLGLLEFAWADMEPNTRSVLEDSLAQYSDTPSWKVSPSEVCGVLRGLRVIGAVQSQLQTRTVLAITTALARVLPRLRPKELSTLANDLGLAGFEYALLSHSLQDALTVALRASLTRMSCWDLVETVISLARLKIPSAFFVQSSLFVSLAGKSGLLGPYPTAQLLLGLGLLRSQRVHIDADMQRLAQGLSVRWTARMPRDEFFKAALGLALLSSSQSSASGLEVSIESAAAPFMHQSQRSVLTPSRPALNASKTTICKPLVDLEAALAEMGGAQFFAFAATLPSHGVDWQLVRLRDLQPCFEQCIIRELSAASAMGSVPLILAALASFSRTAVSLRMHWTSLSLTFHTAYTHIVQDMLQMISVVGIQGCKADAIDWLWGAGYMRADLYDVTSVVSSLLDQADGVQTLKILLALGGLGWRIPLEPSQASTEVLGRSSHDSFTLSERLLHKVGATLSSDNFASMCVGLSRAGFHMQSTTSDDRRAASDSLSDIRLEVSSTVLSYIDSLDPQTVFVPAALLSLGDMGFLHSLEQEDGGALLSKISAAVDDLGVNDLGVILQSLVYIPSESSEKLYVAKRIFLVAAMKGKSSFASDERGFVDLIFALSRVFLDGATQLSDSEEDLEIGSEISSFFGQLASVDCRLFPELLSSFAHLGLPWEDIKSHCRSAFQSGIDLGWRLLPPNTRIQVASLVETLGAWDLLLPVDVEPENVGASWATLDELTSAVKAVRTCFIPDILLACARKNIRTPSLMKAGVWALVDAHLTGTEGNCSSLHPVTVKLPMLLNALDKLFVKEGDLSSDAVSALRRCLHSSLKYMPARSVSNCLYYSARLKFVLDDELKISFRRAFFRTCVFMTGDDGEFANALWAMPHLSIKWHSLSDGEISCIDKAFRTISSSMNGRDIATAIGALRSLGASWTTLPEGLGDILLESAAYKIESMDATSTALLLFSLGMLGVAWSSLPIVIRAVVQEKLPRLTAVLSEKEAYWIVVGLAKMGFILPASNANLVSLFFSLVRLSLLSSQLKPEGFLSVLQCTGSIVDPACAIPSALKDAAIRSMESKLTLLAPKQVVQLLESLAGLQLPWSALSAFTQDKICMYIDGAAAWLSRKNHSLLVIRALLSSGASCLSLSDRFADKLIISALANIRYLNADESSSALSLLRQFHLSRARLSSSQISLVSSAVSVAVGSGSVTSILIAIRDVKSMGLTAVDLEAACLHTLTNLALKCSLVNKDNRLLYLLTSMGASISTTSSASQIDIHKKVALDSALLNIKLIETLRKKLPLLSDEDFLRVIYLLGYP